MRDAVTKAVVYLHKGLLGLGLFFFTFLHCSTVLWENMFCKTVSSFRSLFLFLCVSSLLLTDISVYLSSPHAVPQHLINNSSWPKYRKGWENMRKQLSSGGERNVWNPRRENSKSIPVQLLQLLLMHFSFRTFIYFPHWTVEAHSCQEN